MVLNGAKIVPKWCQNALIYLGLGSAPQHVVLQRCMSVWHLAQKKNKLLTCSFDIDATLLAGSQLRLLGSL